MLSEPEEVEGTTATSDPVVAAAAEASFAVLTVIVMALVAVQADRLSWSFMGDERAQNS